MRPIKFRAWFKDVKKMGFPFDPFLEPMGWKAEGDNVYFMQFTGLLDKNGKEIYEGDIVWCKLTRSHAGSNNDVHWADTLGGWYVYSTPLYHAKEVEVIGNIHENPELLNGN